jgi:hypothetical protein
VFYMNIRFKEELTLPDGATAHDLLVAVYSDPSQSLALRIRCAVAAIPYELPKLAVTANVTATDLTMALEQRLARLAAQPPERLLNGHAAPPPTIRRRA